MRFQTVVRVLLIVSVIAVVPASASAQDAPEFGIKAGFNVSTIKVDFADSHITSGGRAGIVVGFWGAKDFSPRAGLHVEALLEQKGGDFAADGMAFNDDTNFKLTYLSFPLLGRFNFAAGSSTIRLLTGPSFNFHVSDSVTVGGEELEGEGEAVEVKTLEMGWVIGGQAAIKNFVIDVRYIWGLTDTNASEDEGDPTAKNKSFQLTFGWRFK